MGYQVSDYERAISRPGVSGQTEFNAGYSMGVEMPPQEGSGAWNTAGLGQGAAQPLARGFKVDQSKEPLALLSWIWLQGVARVLAFGAQKYAPDNWRRGIERRRLISAALRHLLAYGDGEDDNPETGLSHIDHASCCLMFIRETHETHPELDDRYKGVNK